MAGRDLSGCGISVLLIPQRAFEIAKAQSARNGERVKSTPGSIDVALRRSGPETGIDQMSAYAIFFVYALAIIGFVGVTLLMNRVIGPQPAPAGVKLEPFECGAVPVDPINVRAVPIKYYAVAIIFILFDLETVFFFIWALGAQPVTGLMLVTYALFTVLLVLIMFYVFKARLLESVTE
jgi:NADH-quinone oxidoreductase subunit A